MKDQEQIVAWIGVDWADEGHHVLGIQRGHWRQGELCGPTQRRIVAGVAEPSAKQICGKASSSCCGTGTWRIDLFTNEYGLRRHLSGQSTVIGEIPEGPLSGRGKKRSRGCRTVGRNGPAKSRALSSMGAG